MIGMHTVRPEKNAKKILRTKKKEFNDAIIHKLTASIHYQYTFWHTTKKQNLSKAKYFKNNISMNTCFQNFKRLLDTKVDNPVVELIEDSDEALNRLITKEEIILAFKILKNKKAARPDRIISELLKHSCSSVIEFFPKVFNELFNKGVFPEKWSESIILPLLKNGDLGSPNNDRGVMLVVKCMDL